MMLQIFMPVNWSETLATTTKSKPRMQTYVVQEGDTIAGIALRYAIACLFRVLNCHMCT